jgi:hypothetical protein
MGRFYEPRKDSPRGYIPGGYDPTVDAGTSVSDTSDLNTGTSYNVDTRNLDTEEQKTAGPADTRNQRQEARVQKFMAAAKSAGKFKQSAALREPTSADQGEVFSPVGSTQYSAKPKRTYGLPFV